LFSEALIVLSLRRVALRLSKSHLCYAVNEHLLTHQPEITKGCCPAAFHSLPKGAISCCNERVLEHRREDQGGRANQGRLLYSIKEISCLRSAGLALNLESNTLIWNEISIFK